MKDRLYKLRWKNKLLGKAYFYNTEKYENEIFNEEDLVKPKDIQKIKFLYVTEGSSLADFRVIRGITKRFDKVYYYNEKDLLDDLFYLSYFPSTKVYLKGKIGYLKVLYNKDKTILYRCFRNVKTLKLPSSLKNISELAFSNIKNLEYIDLPEGLETIGSNAFSGCPNLRSISIPDSVWAISDCVFSYDFKLGYVKLPKNLKTLSFGTFYKCYALKEIDIPESVESIEDDVFYKCVSLKKIHLPEGLKKLLPTFGECKRLEEINIPKNIETVKILCFLKCYNLKKIKIENKDFRLVDSSFINSNNKRFIINKIPIENIGVSLFIRTLDEIFNYNTDKPENLERHLNNWKSILRKKSFWNYIKDLEEYVINNIPESNVLEVIKYMIENGIINKKNFKSILDVTKIYNNCDINSILLDYQFKNNIEINVFEDMEEYINNLSENI